jgi:hypothetical protein
VQIPEAHFLYCVINYAIIFLAVICGLTIMFRHQPDLCPAPEQAFGAFLRYKARKWLHEQTSEG